MITHTHTHTKASAHQWRKDKTSGVNVCSHYFKLFQVCDINNFIVKVSRIGYDSPKLFNRIDYVTYCCVKPFWKNFVMSLWVDILHF